MALKSVAVKFYLKVIAINLSGKLKDLSNNKNVSQEKLMPGILRHKQKKDKDICVQMSLVSYYSFHKFVGYFPSNLRLDINFLNGSLSSL